MESIIKERKEGKRVYISGAISGKDLNERMKAFSVAEAKLSEYCLEAVNPLKIGIEHIDDDTATHMKRDIKLLLECDTIYMMRGWNHSAGCQTELQVALACGLDVMFEEKEIGLRVYRFA